MYILQPETIFYSKCTKKHLPIVPAWGAYTALPRAPSWIKGASRQERTTKGQGRNKGWTGKRDRLDPFHKFLDPPVV